MTNHIKSMTAIALFAATLSILTVLPGCASKQNSSSIKSQSYADDGLLGRTNSYPKIPSRHMALNYDNDYKLMTQSIKNLRGVAGSSVTFSGADAYVTVKLQPGLALNERHSVESQAATTLRFNFPRYHIHVKTLE